MPTKLKKQEPKFSLSDCDDLASVNAVLQGKKSGYDNIYNKYYIHIYNKILKSVNYCHEEAEDLTQEVFIKIYENIHKYTKEYTFNAWMTAVANNYVNDYFRKAKAERVRINSLSIDRPVHIDSGHSDDVNNIVYELPSHASDAMELDEKMKDIIRTKIICRALSRLPEADREIMEMYIFGHMQYQDIASRLDVGLSYVKLKIKRGKDKIAGLINSRAAVVEVASTYAIQQADIEMMQMLNLKYKNIE